MSERVSIAAVDVRPEDIEAVSRVLRSGNLRQGAVVQDLENEFAARAGAAHAVAVSSGTAALHLAYLAMFRPGDEVIVPSFTFVATASMLLAMGAVPVFADVDRRTFTLSPDDVRRSITENTRGVAPVHLFGNTCDMDGLMAVAAEHRLSVVWDAAQALGTKYQGRDVGSFPSAVCYSFYPTKNITTGEGGMITTDDAELAGVLRLSRSHGAAAKYVYTALGFNYRMTDFQAALGREQLRRLDDYLEARQSNAKSLTAQLEGIHGITPPFVPGYATHTFNQYSVLIDEQRVGWNRDDLGKRLSELGVETAVHYPTPLHRQAIFGASEARLPVTERLCKQIISLPVHPLLSSSELSRVGTALLKECPRP
ncbi:MAG: DegT/DnrJ/EryC1/StrS family aminotransferase [Actinomycetota bacterium]|nr:DegT/DnrJ/EryC1/StrS family aminotransferase [Actinomycetota bacterium]